MDQKFRVTCIIEFPAHTVWPIQTQNRHLMDYSIQVINRFCKKFLNCQDGVMDPRIRCGLHVKRLEYNQVTPAKPPWVTLNGTLDCPTITGLITLIILL